MALGHLIALLERPEELKKVISGMRLRTDLSEEEHGFLVLYDHYKGDAEKIRTYLKKTQEHILTGGKVVKRINSVYRVAAVFIILLGTGLFFLLNRSMTNLAPKEESEKSEIFSEPGVPIFMGEEHKIDWAPLMFAIDKETPQRALEEWKKIEKLDPQNDTLIYFGGIVFKELDKLVEAKSFFEINANSTSVFADRSAYFLLQMAKSEGNKAEAKELLDRLKNTEDLDLKPFVILEQRTRNKEQ